ncbi:hypothetical protein KHS38_15445 [Mucilaginibacter sp. Bleaf8]|uniref:hypothetical protein n=1 Tax=Mucilaginibacter sp. Bleaf8 TaxID=2834430 RepID=UPI001BCBDA5C|nr:hypothetical protein [Mucilaginibacter sp. Bleaf8]MBS7565801.1 hypothetical protein [Mucilaginibacter sp. Bleaf8]
MMTFINTTKGKLCGLLVLVLLLSACKKDALKVDEEKHYEQVNASPSTDPIIGSAISLTLKPDGVGDIVPGGDIRWNATYKISGKKLTVAVKDIDHKFEFTIISDDEIHGENGEILKRSYN